ncbi:MAG: DUF3502 domain-containing protein, partial [Lachnospiraceae bacterium]|nr:DUF3502 domain-containing protein [Lachnospiraceae bacterium]
NCLIRMEGYHPIDELSSKDSAVYYTIDDNTNKWQAVNAAEEQSLIKLWKTIKEYKDKGWIYFANSTVDAFVKRGNFLFLVLATNHAQLVGNEMLYGEKYNVAVGDEWYEANYEITAKITGIASWSEYKDEAFKLLTLVNTKEELSRLLVYGIEGKHYVYKDGELIGFDSNGVASVDYATKINHVGNPNLLHPTGLEPDNKLEFYKEIGENFKDSPSMIYDIDMSAYEDKLSNISKIYNEYLDKLNTGKCEDVDAAVAEMNVRLKEAGITEIVNDINRQLEAAQQ